VKDANDETAEKVVEGCGFREIVGMLKEKGKEQEKEREQEKRREQEEEREQETAKEKRRDSSEWSTIEA
jgi:hypothetical protein